MSISIRRLVILTAWALALLAATLTHSQGVQPDRASLATLPATKPVNAALAELGRNLYFDPRLSADGSRSCASCHMPGKGWADGDALARAYPGSEYFRNAPGLINARHRVRFMWDGRLDGTDLGGAVRDMVTQAHFMHADARLVQERIKQAPGYLALWREAYGPGSEPSAPKLFDALGEFVKTLASHNVPFDRYLSGDTAAMNRSATAGLRLFQGKAGCIACHRGALLSDGQRHRLDVPENLAITAEPLRHITMLRYFAASGLPNYMQERTDVGAFAVTKSAEDRGKFQTPSLRELKYTAPYMHNGLFQTLTEVVDFYDRGAGPNSGLKPLGLSQVEKRDLLAFLDTLSGDPVGVVQPQHLENSLYLSTVPSLPATADIRPGTTAPELALIVPLAPLPPVPVPSDNLATPEKIELGKMLFFDRRLSGDGSTACASCHFPELGWGERSTVSRGYPSTRQWRNTLTVLNAAHFGKLFWDGAAGSLEAQAPFAAQGAVEGNGDPAMMEMRLRFVPDYVARFRRVFGTEWPSITHAWQAIAAFERTVVSDPSKVPFDRYMNGEKAALSSAAVKGLTLFSGKAGCIRCHNGPLVSDQGFHSTSVPRNDVFRDSPLHQITQRWQNAQHGAPEATYRAGPQDMGLYYRTRKPADIGKFRTPSLRELKYTAPYMHNGSLADLRQVIDFYDQGGGVEHKTDLLQPLALSSDEKLALLAFLESLSMDEPLLVTPPSLPEYQAMQ